MSVPTAAQIEAVRIEAINVADDTDTLPDSVIRYHWEADGGEEVLLTAALCCDGLAKQAARHFPWTADGQSMQMQVRQAQYRQSALDLRRRYYGTSIQTMTRPAATSEDEFDGE